MKKQRIRDTPEIKVAKGYELDEVMDTDDEGYDHGEPIKMQEVKLDFE